MRFAFGERQVEFRSQLRALADKECSAADVRAAWGSPLGWSAARWASMAEVGVTGLTVPESYGGLGLGMVDLVLLLEEAGRACLPEPLLETVALGVPALAGASGERAEEVRLDWLPRVTAGEAVLSVGLSSMATVPVADGAHLLLLEHRDEGACELHAVLAGDVEHRRRPVLDGSRRQSEITWTPTPATLVASGADAEAAVSGISERAAMGSGALLLGLAERMISMTAQHAADRRQFGKPIGSFQAVKHQLAGALVHLEFARPLVYRAAWSIDSATSDVGLHAAMAKAKASDAANLAARTALQVHGAIGYTWEHDLHLWMKRAWAIAASWGDAATQRSRVLEARLEARLEPDGEER